MKIKLAKLFAAVCALVALGCLPACAGIFSTQGTEPTLDSNSQRQSLLNHVINSQTERAMKSRVLGFFAWVVSDPDERAGMSNYRDLRAAMKKSALPAWHKVHAYFFDVSDVWPADCSTRSLKKTQRRIAEMSMAARATDKESLAHKLDNRAKYLRKVGAEVAHLCNQ